MDAAQGHQRTVAAGLRGHDNSFGVLRLFLASSVIFSHAFYLGGWREDPTLGLTRGQETIGGWAVVGFFVISGYLITKSGASADIVQFLWRRVLRIFPAFWVALAVGALLVGPIVWLNMGRSLGEYMSTAPGGPVGYVTANWKLAIHQWGVHDIFIATTPYGEATGASVFNGSLWTLEYEWRAYMIIAVLVLLGVLRRAPWLILACLAIFYSAALGAAFAPSIFPRVSVEFSDRFFVNLTLAFLLGATLAVFGPRVVLDGRLALAAGALVVVTLAVRGWVLVGYPAFAYLLIYTAARLPAGWRKIGAKNDYSYGMYVYGFLVQQFTAYWGWHKWGYVPWVADTLLVTAGCAVVSWHLVEKPALRLKAWCPGVGIRRIASEIQSRLLLWRRPPPDA